MKVWLLDTGPVVAYLDSRDPGHIEVAACLEAFTGRFATTSAVITEAMHFVSISPQGPRLLAEFVAQCGADVYDLCRPKELPQAVSLMEKYRDTPMDFADATLVLLAEAIDAYEVVTLDRRGFSAYRTRQRRSLRLVLDR